MPSGKSRKFHLGDVLTITTGCLVSNRHMEGVYDILNFITGEDLFTHQLPRAMRFCQPILLGRFPELVEVSAKKVTSSNHERWLAEQVENLCATEVERVMELKAKAGT